MLRFFEHVEENCGDVFAIPRHRTRTRPLDNGRAVAAGQLDFDAIGRRLRTAHVGRNNPAARFCQGNQAVLHAALVLIDASLGEGVGVEMRMHCGAKRSGIDL